MIIFGVLGYILKTHQPKIIVLTGAIAVGKTTLGKTIESCLLEKGVRVKYFDEVTDGLEEELRMFYKDTKKYALWFQYKILRKHKKMMKRIFDINYRYDYIILDRTHLDQIVFSKFNIDDEEDLAYMLEKIEKIKMKFDKVIYVRPIKENMVKRYLTDREGFNIEELNLLKNYWINQYTEIVSDVEYVKEIYNQYEKMIDEIYPTRYLFENNVDVSEYDVNELLKYILK